MASLKRKRVSKKNKISWRKNVDITDVENFLEDQRLEERLGGKAADKSNEDLFSIDITGTPSLDKTNGKTNQEAVNKPLKLKENNVENGEIVGDGTEASNIETPLKVVQIKAPVVRKSLRVKETITPKCYSLLERRSAVEDPVIKRNTIKNKEKFKKLPKDNIPGKFIKKKNSKPEIEFRDVWGEKDQTRELCGLTEWLTPDTVRHTLHNTGHKDRKMPASLRVKPSPLAAVEVPHPGTSYNPSLEDHRQLLHQVVEVELKEEKEEEHIRRVTTRMFRKISPEEVQKNWLKEMSGGIQPSSGEESDEGGDYSTVNPPALRKKKTLQKRRKIKEERERKRAALAKKVEKKKRSDVNERLPKLQKSIQKKEKESAEFQKRKEERIKLKVGDTKVLSKTKFAAPRLEFQSPKDLSGNLRKLNPEGSVLRDRYLSLQRRNILEPTQVRHVRKAKVKRFVKGSHKMGWEPKGY